VLFLDRADAPKHVGFVGNCDCRTQAIFRTVERHHKHVGPLPFSVIRCRSMTAVMFDAGNSASSNTAGQNWSCSSGPSVTVR